MSLSIDLSGYVGDLAKPFATQLHANDDCTRESAVKCVASLALRCSDSEAILTLLRSIFAVLNGSEGKLTVANHKMSLLSAIASLADNSILGKLVIFNLKLCSCGPRSRFSFEKCCLMLNLSFIHLP